MKTSHHCPKCGSTDIIADAKAVDRGHCDSENELTVATFWRPEALLFKGEVTSTVSAWVCVGCGYVEFYADNPQLLKLCRTS
jgi:predicted nucleic-acid-binding Zn-ribbon protein